MFEFGFSELLLIGAVALVVLGPERLPQVARAAGFWLGKIRSYVDSVKSELNRQVEAAELREVKESVESAAQSLRESVQDINRSATSEVNALADGLDVRPAWERLPAQKTPADYGVDTTPRLKTLNFSEPPKRTAGVKVADVDELVAKLKALGVAA